jgi:nucleoside-diphosphate-sugar epimerase
MAEMRVAVTGSSGKIGRPAVAALVAAGHKVIGLDLRPEVVDGVRTVGCDCTDFGQVIGALSGVDTMARPTAIVHLAGIPMPGLHTDQTIFAANTLSTYNVFSAAARLGIQRIVWGSSETILGLPFATPPAFVPLDETHPDRPEWSYALSKKLGETMAEEFCRWNRDLTIVSLRFSNVYAASDYAARGAIEADPRLRRSNLWGYVDARDAGEACRLAIEADLSGHERMIIAAADTVVGTPSADLLAQHFPDVPRHGAIAGHDSLLSSARARDRIGYVPRHSWRDQ